MRAARYLAGAVLAGCAPAWAQCSMCRTAAAAQEAGAAQALDAAIVVLLVPAVALFTGVFLFAFRSDAASREGRPR